MCEPAEPDRNEGIEYPPPTASTLRVEVEGRMRILLVSDEFGWPENSGYRARIANIARALATMGVLEWVVIAQSDPTGLGGPRELAIDPRVVRARPRPRALGLAIWTMSPRPWRLAALKTSEIRRDLRHAVADLGQFDLVFFTQLDTMVLAEPLVAEHLADGATVAVDFNDVESHKLLHRLATPTRGQGLHERLRRSLLRLDRRKWVHLETQTARRRVSFVCSDLDRARIGGSPHVLANCAPAPPPGFARFPDPARPILLFVGSLTYEPNVDAIEFAAAEVLPLVRRSIPEAVLRIVGRGANERVLVLADQPGVEVVGEVATVAPELAIATLALVPVRFGGGTRVKILEAFAHRVPVISTSIGAEGLAVRNGEHCILADGAAALAEACVRLLTSPADAQRLADAGAALVLEQHDPTKVRAEFVATLLQTQRLADPRSDRTVS